MRQKKQLRQKKLVETLAQNPFMTDEELAAYFSVSIQTIRLDRLEQNIPELRERIKDEAIRKRDTVIALHPDEVFGEIVDLQLDEHAISIFDVGKEHVFARSGIARGHHLFAQANSLAVALMNEALALTAKAHIHFTTPVKEGSRVIAKAIACVDDQGRTLVTVTSRVQQEIVFKGEFFMYRGTVSSPEEEGGNDDETRD
ncbi:transcription factor FapR [Shouchella lonarensis]|nr:transcription factor FapR [Shouchella lonarensis]